MNVLSLFDGMSCGQIALNRAGIKYDQYFASEIDKSAMKVTMANYPDTIQIGDVTKVDGRSFPRIDLLMGGSPCQGFSVAGKRLKFADPRSALIMDYFRILDICKAVNPKVYFILENVPMDNKCEIEISRRLGVNPIKINAALVSAQNRVRLFWCNFGIESSDMYGHVSWSIPQPQDRGIVLKDILESEVDEKYYLSEKALARIQRKEYLEPKINPDKTGCLNTKNNSGQLSVDSGTTLITDINGKPKKKQGHDNHGSRTMILQRPRGKNKGGEHTEKSPTMSGNSWHTNHGVIQINPSLESGGQQPFQQNRVYNPEGKSPHLAAQLPGGGMIRRLTPIECERLQGVPDFFTAHTSDSQRYKMLGNGWNVDCVVHILKHMK